MTDELLLAEKIGALEEEKRQLKAENVVLAGKVKGLQADLRWKAVRHWTISFLVALGVLAGFGWLGWKAVNSYDTNECYIERGQRTIDAFTINRKVEWWPDRELGFSTDLDKALEIGRKQGCRVHKLPEAP